MSKILRGGRPPATDTDSSATEPSGPARARAVIPAPVYDAEREAERIVAEARAQAERLVAEAGAEAERLRADATAEGAAAGRAEAGALLVAAEAARARLHADAERDIARLAVQIARKIVVGELALGDAAVVRIVSQALASARLGRAVVVRIHPEDAARLQDAFPTLLAAAGRSEGIVLRPDPALGRGDCVVESELGTIDARLQTQLAAIEKALVGSGGDGGAGS